MKKSRRTNEQSLAEAIDAFLEKSNLKNRQEELHVVDQWAEVMGAVIAKHTVSVDLRRKILYVKLDSASLRHELSLNREKIVRMMNEQAAADVVNNLKLL